MRNYPNIDKSAFKKGEYVGYAKGVWRIIPWGNGWKAWCRLHADNVILHAATLAEMSQLLLEEEKKPKYEVTPVLPNPLA